RRGRALAPAMRQVCVKTQMLSQAARSARRADVVKVRRATAVLEVLPHEAGAGMRAAMRHHRSGREHNALVAALPPVTEFAIFGNAKALVEISAGAERVAANGHVISRDKPGIFRVSVVPGVNNVDDELAGGRPAVARNAVHRTTSNQAIGIFAQSRSECGEPIGL